MDSADFGVPQHRLRVYIIGVRCDLLRPGFAFGWPRPRPGKPAGLGGTLEPLTAAEAEAHRLTAAQWAIVRSTNFYRDSPARRVPPLALPAATLRASYHSGYKLYSQFVRIPECGPAVPTVAPPPVAPRLVRGCCAGRPGRRLVAEESVDAVEEWVEPERAPRFLTVSFLPLALRWLNMSILLRLRI